MNTYRNKKHYRHYDYNRPRQTEGPAPTSTVPPCDHTHTEYLSYTLAKAGAQAQSYQDLELHPVEQYQYYNHSPTEHDKTRHTPLRVREVEPTITAWRDDYCVSGTRVNDPEKESTNDSISSSIGLLQSPRQPLSPSDGRESRCDYTPESTLESRRGPRRKGDTAWTYDPVEDQRGRSIEAQPQPKVLHYRLTVDTPVAPRPDVLSRTTLESSTGSSDGPQHQPSPLPAPRMPLLPFRRPTTNALDSRDVENPKVCESPGSPTMQMCSSELAVSDSETEEGNSSSSTTSSEEYEFCDVPRLTYSHCAEEAPTKPQCATTFTKSASFRLCEEEKARLARSLPSEEHLAKETERRERERREWVLRMSRRDRERESRRNLKASPEERSSANKPVATPEAKPLRQPSRLHHDTSEDAPSSSGWRKYDEGRFDVERDWGRTTRHMVRNQLQTCFDTCKDAAGYMENAVSVHERVGELHETLLSSLSRLQDNSPVTSLKGKLEKCEQDREDAELVARTAKEILTITLAAYDEQLSAWEAEKTEMKQLFDSIVQAYHRRAAEQRDLYEKRIRELEMEVHYLSNVWKPIQVPM